ncbi:MAG: ABC transporter substrate-binding protein [Roseiarcus sp.]
MVDRISRRGFLKSAAVGGVFAPAVLTRPGWAQTGPIRIGFIEPRGGPNKYIGDSRMAAVDFVVERVNAAGGLLGRKVESVVADSELKPDIASRRANDMLLGDKVDALCAFGGAVAKVTAQIANANKKIFFSTSTLPTEMTGAEFLPTTFSLAFNSEMLAQAVAAQVAKMSQTKVYVLCQDYASGRSAAQTFKKRFEQLKRSDQSIVGEEYHPAFKINDFAPYITKIMASGAEILMTANFGPDLRLLMQQGHQLGWPVKVVGFYLNDSTLTSVLGDAAVGNITVGVAMATLNTPLNMETIKAWRARYPDAPISHRVPDLQTGQSLAGISWFLDAVKKAGSLDTESIIKAWEGDRAEILWGPAQMRACDHQLQSGCGVATIEKPGDIPEAIRFFPEFPYIGSATLLPVEAVSIPPGETGNKRCAA